jgi:hypothetical protein
MLILTAYIESCQETGFTPARGLGLLVLEMIQKGVIPKHIQEGGKLVPNLPILWSAELINFLEITSHCSLSDIKMVTYYLTCEKLLKLIKNRIRF